MSVISTAASGLTAAATRLSVSAANVNAWGAEAVQPIEGARYVEPVQPIAPVPRPMRALLSAQAQGGVMAAAQAQTQAARPGDIDLARETVEQVQAMAAFRANLSMIRTADEMDQALLDTLA